MAASHGNWSKGEHRPSARLTEDGVIAMRTYAVQDEFGNWTPQLQHLANWWGVSRVCIWKILHGKSWRYLL